MSERRPRRKNAEEVSRRNFLKGTVGATVAAAGSMAGLGYMVRNPNAAGSLSRIAENIEGAHGSLVPVNFTETGLAGEKVSGLAADFFGIRSGEQYPEGTKEIDFQSNLDHMWAKKVAVTRHLSHKDVGSMEELATMRTAEYKELSAEGKEKGSIRNFNELVTSFKETGTAVLNGMDWDALQRYYNISDRWTLDMMHHIASRAHGRSLAAYSMTEIMPGGAGSEANAIRIYDTLLRTAGSSFVARVPALGDSLDSYGQFQLTPIAIDRRIAQNHRLKLDAGDPLITKYNSKDDSHINVSLIDLMSPATRLPEHIRDYSQVEQHTAGAVMLGLDAVGNAIRLLHHGDADDEQINRIAHMDGGTFASVLAAHHYRPAVARPALVAWSQDHNWANDGMAHEPYYAFCGKSKEVASYAKRSFNNFEEVEGYFKLQGY